MLQRRGQLVFLLLMVLHCSRLVVGLPEAWPGHAQDVTQHHHSLSHHALSWLSRFNGSTSGSPVTLVAALYDLNRRDNGDGRSIDQYKQWFTRVLSITSPMVVYVEDEGLQKWVLEQRPGLQTICVLVPFTTSPYYHFVKDIENITSRPGIDKNWMEHKLPKYVPFQFTKFYFMNMVTRVNPFQSEWFFWVDAGSGRWSGAAERRHWPNLATLQQVVSQHVTAMPFLIIQRTDKEMESRDDFNYKKAVQDGSPHLCGTVFGGNPEVFSLLHYHALAFLKDTLSRGLVRNEQTFLGVMARMHPEMFHTFPKACQSKGCDASRADDWLSIYDHLS